MRSLTSALGFISHKGPDQVSSYVDGLAWSANDSFFRSVVRSAFVFSRRTHPLHPLCQASEEQETKALGEFPPGGSTLISNPLEMRFSGMGSG